MNVFSHSTKMPGSYDWRLPKAQAQGKLEPLDMKAMENLFGSLKDAQDLELQDAPRPAQKFLQ